MLVLALCLVFELYCIAVILQIKNSLARAFSRKKNVGGKADSMTASECDNISIHSDISAADSAAEYLSTPAVRTADWFV